MPSEISGLALPCFAPPEFPAGGRLKLSEEKVNENYKKQISKVEEDKTTISKKCDVRIGFKCSQSLHISLFFDGTNNNEYNDTPAHPTNIAKLFHATYQNAESEGYFRYYIPGVGTPFPKIGEIDYSNSGLEFATGGEDRINWALLRLVDALIFAIDPNHKQLDDNVAKKLVSDMRAHWPLTLIKRGRAPYTTSKQRVGGRGTFKIHHIDEIQYGGEVYEIDNLRVNTPKNHIRLHK
ncbi:DUF2235 domain-containing protein [Salmonella enterica]|nr:DUF2235 domain-containing protein [Salmonella enterica]